MRHIAIAVLAACGDNATPPDKPVDIRESVLELHGSPTRTGAYITPNLTHAAAAGLHIDPTFAGATYNGHAFAQALYYDAGGPGDLVIAATEANEIAAFTPDGTTVWKQILGDPQRMPNPDDGAPCGDIDPLGITGTPVIDYATRTLYFDAMIHENDHAHHRIYAVSLDDGSTLKGWPIDPGNVVTDTATPFLPATQNQRGGLTLLHHRLYVPYGGHAGDCGDYHGFVVSIAVDDPGDVTTFETRDHASGAWTPGGVSSDGSNVYVVFGNGEAGETWGNSESVIRFGDGARFSGDTKDFWVPENWQNLDLGDVDLTGPPIVFDQPESTPSALLAATGKDGFVYLVDRDNMGGIKAPLASIKASSPIISVSAVYRTALGTYMVVRGHGVDGCPGLTQASTLVAVRVDPGSPPQLSLAWCSHAGMVSSPIATTTDGMHDPIVWVIGAEGDNRFHGYDGDTGDVIFAGGGPNDAMGSTSRFISPMYAKGRLFVAADGQVYAYTP